MPLLTLTKLSADGVTASAWQFARRCRALFAWLALGLALGGTLLASPCRARAGDGIQTAGDVLQFALPGAAYGSTLYHRDLPGAFEYSESLGTTLGTTYILKYTVNEKRPNGGSQSFPSGHTSAAVSAAEFLRKRYGWEYGLPAYALAGFVGYSRVESNQHHPHDVLAGAAIGFASSFLFTKHLPLRLQAEPMSGSGGAQGIKFVRVW